MFGALSGFLVASVVFLDTQRIIWRGAASFCRDHGTLPPAEKINDDAHALYGPKTRLMAAMLWNRLIDESVGRVATELANKRI